MGTTRNIGAAMGIAALATLMGAGIATAAAGTVSAHPLAQRGASTTLTSAAQTASLTAIPADHGGGNNGGGGGRDDGGHDHDHDGGGGGDHDHDR
jgi:hypothetical protein